ncbi:MAG: heme A synthase [Alphaproteobacteria bacterium]|nr:heme A synthase [Alphaproteobacteria bacterium]
MVVLGGLTRLTHAGLAIVEWRPLTGMLPPLSQDDWQQAFAAYRQFPEYQKLNKGMSLADFKGIFWLEYLHRLLGRGIGLALVIPYGWFLWRGWIGRDLHARLAGLLALGALQGAIGWWMVTSGLVDHPDVSPYRLTVHLGLALCIYGYILWTALDVLRPPPEAPPGAGGPRQFAFALMALIGLVVLSGALVAGTDAGFGYNTFPLMDGRWFPDGAFLLQPWFVNFAENVALVQFNHRLLAILTLAAGTMVWLQLRRPLAECRATGRGTVLVLALFIQVGLGVATLLSVVWLPLAALHQAMAFLLFAAVLAVAHALPRSRP